MAQSELEFSSKYLASQVAGSCRIEGIRVSDDQEQTMRGIIDGTVDVEVERMKLLARFRLLNSSSGKQ